MNVWEAPTFPGVRLPSGRRSRPGASSATKRSRCPCAFTRTTVRDVAANVAEGNRLVYARLAPLYADFVLFAAADWSKLGDRMNFIVDYFRSRQQSAKLMQPPFSASQTEAIRAGRLPVGPL